MLQVLLGFILMLPHQEVLLPMTDTNQPKQTHIRHTVKKPKLLKETKEKYLITAYTANCKGCSGITASGKRPVKGVTVACPPSLSLGTWIRIDGLGERRCDDRGGAIKGRHIDLYMTSYEKAIEFGVQRRAVEILD